MVASALSRDFPVQRARQLFPAPVATFGERAEADKQDGIVREWAASPQS